MRPWPSSLRARLTLWYTVLLAIPLIAFAIAAFVVVSRALERHTDAFIGDALTAFSRELFAERRASWPMPEAMRRTVAEVRFRELNIAILAADGSVIAMTAFGADEADASVARRPSPDVETRLLTVLRTYDLRQPVSLTVPSANGAYRIVARPIEADGERFTLTGAYSRRDIEAVLQRVRQMFAVAIPLLLVAAAFGGYALARRSLAPVAAMASQAAAITATNMHERLPATGGDELVGLARVVNSLLDRLEQSFDRQRRFIADASHELRTPTAVVRSEADITLSRLNRPEAEFRESVTVIRDAAQRLTRIVDDLFLLSRADAGHLVSRPGPLYLEEVVHQATRAVHAVASERAVDVILRDVVEAPIVGDPDLLGRLLLNLLDNAIKYAPRGSTVDVVMTASNTHYTVSVIDAGPGIPVDERDRVFERFVRLDTARARAETTTTSGAGLGLAIARRIAEMHDGRLEIADSRPGRTEFRVTLPRAALA